MDTRLPPSAFAPREEIEAYARSIIVEGAAAELPSAEARTLLDRLVPIAIGRVLDVAKTLTLVAVLGVTTVCAALDEGLAKRTP